MPARADYNAESRLTRESRSPNAIGMTSLGRMVVTNIESLLQFQDGILPDGVDEFALHSRSFDGVQKVLRMRELPAAVKESLASAIDAASDRLLVSPYLSGISRDQ